MTGESAVTSMSERSILMNLLLIWFSAFDEELAGVCATVCHDRYRVGHVVNDQWFVNIHLEISTRTTESDGYIIGSDLYGNHGQSFSLRRIHLAGHDRRTRFIRSDYQLSKARTRAARH